MRSQPFLLVLRILFAGALWPVFLDGAAVPSLVTGPGVVSISGSGNSFAPTFSPDGRFVVFVSEAKNLATNGAPSPWLDVFMRDLETGHTELVSVNTNGFGGGNGDSSHPSVSLNGRYVAFESAAANLVGNDTNNYRDIFVRDMISGVTTLVTVSTNGIESATSGSASPLISADGQRVVFESPAQNLVTNDGPCWDVFLRGLGSGTTTIVSTNEDGCGIGGGVDQSYSLAGGATISADGKYVAFFAASSANGIPTTGGVFVRDVETDVMYLASKNAGAFVTNSTLDFSFYSPVMSANGDYVFFAVSSASPASPVVLRYGIQDGATVLIASNLVGTRMVTVSTNGRFVAAATREALLLVDAEAGTNEIICSQGVTPELRGWMAPAISADSSKVAFLGSESTNGPWSVYVYDRQRNTRELVSVTTNGAPAEVSALSEPAVSADGTRVVFESRADDIVGGDLNHATDIFVRDLTNGTTRLISERAANRASSTPALRSTVGSLSISEFGRFIAFTSLDHSVAEAADDNTWQTAFVHDRLSGTNRVLRTAVSGALGPSRLAFNPVLSANGRYAAWLEHAVPASATTAVATNISWLDLETGAERIVQCGRMALGGPSPGLSADGRWLVFTAPAPGNPYIQVFRRDMFSAEPSNELVTVSYVNGGPTAGNAAAPMATPDGRWIVFYSQASDLLTNGPIPPRPLATLIWARNLGDGQTHPLSTDEFGQFSSAMKFTNVVMSGNSKFVFVHASGVGRVYRHDLETRSSTNLLVCQACSDASVSEDGNIVAYVGDRDVFVRDLRSGETSLVSTNGLGCCETSGNDRSFAPQVSGDGRYVVFASRASNLVPDDTNNATDVFVRDLKTRSTLLVSRNAQDAPAHGFSSSPVLAPDGRTIVFSSSAGDFTPNDFNNTRDLFILRLGGVDSDMDGMDDEWEAAYFDTLDRVGTGDFDHDGASDLQEFRAGTDPTNSGSILRVLTVESVVGAGRVVIWSAQPGRSYRVQFKNALSDPYWSEFSGQPYTVTAEANTASITDGESVPQRFYRVLAEP